ncbi:MAG: hypothetical protein WB579_04470 [Bryobacteraceae bacterium]
MTRKISFDEVESAPRWILLLLGAYLLLHLFALYLWNATGQAFSVQGTAYGTAALSVTAMAAVDLWLCLLVLRGIPAGAPLRSAWMLIALAAAAQAASGLLAQFLGANWLLNPLAWAGQARSGLIDPFRRAALVGGGPVRLALLAAAMLAALRVLRKFGFWVRPSAADWAVSGIVCLFTLCRFGEAGAASFTGRQLAFEDWMSLAGLPILCVLFLEAMLLRQSVLHMGSGLVSRCWAALMCGVFLTGAGELALWVVPHYSHGWPLQLVNSLTGFPTAAVFALAPACLVAAQRRAIKPVSDQPEGLATGVPALAR